jgi:hypothetical protein
VATLICDANFVSIEHSGVGYFLTVRHESLPQRRIVLHEPFVVGRAGGVEGTFLAFIENGELMLECAPVPPSEVPEGFRDMPVSISTEEVAGAENLQRSLSDFDDGANSGQIKEPAKSPMHIILIALGCVLFINVPLIISFANGFRSFDSFGAFMGLIVFSFSASGLVLLVGWSSRLLVLIADLFLMTTRLMTSIRIAVLP